MVQGQSVSPSDFIRIVTEALGDNSDESDEPQALLRLLHRNDLDKTVKLIVLNCIVKNCGKTMPMSIFDPFRPLSDIDGVEAHKISATSTMVCIRYIDGVKDCYMIVLMNREFNVKAVTDPNDVLQKMNMKAQQEEKDTAEEQKSEPQSRQTRRVDRDAIIRKLSGLE